jgi:hypothetical protein
MGNNIEIEVKENTSKGQTVRTYCNRCRQEMNHQIVMDYCKSGRVVVDSEFDLTHGRREYTASFECDYQIVECSGCNTISYRSSCFDEEIADETNDGTSETRFPVPQKRKEKKFKHLPSILSQIYQEVMTAYNNSGFVLCAAGIRAVLEGICKDKGITDGKLNEKIKKMREQELISQPNESILHELRFLGNAAIHELQVPTYKELEAALDIIEHMVEDLYEIEGKAKILKRPEDL